MKIDNVMHERCVAVDEGVGGWASVPFGDSVVLVACAENHILYTIVDDDLALCGARLRELVNRAHAEGYPIELSPEVKSFLDEQAQAAGRRRR